MDMGATTNCRAVVRPNHERLRRTVLVGELTREIVSESLKARFVQLEEAEADFGNFPIKAYEKNDIIKTALNLGLTELAGELTERT